MVLTGMLVGDTATYSCNAGFVLFGKGIRDCQLDGTWSHKTPECRVIDCGELVSPSNGAVALSGSTFGFTASYTCNPGFLLVGGGQTRVCQISGSWSGEAPVCCATTCIELQNPDNGIIELLGTEFGDVATYSCSIGFRLSGDQTRRCQSNGQWSGEEPACTLTFRCIILCTYIYCVSN